MGAQDNDNTAVEQQWGSADKLPIGDYAMAIHTETGQHQEIYKIDSLNVCSTFDMSTSPARLWECNHRVSPKKEEY